MKKILFALCALTGFAISVSAQGGARPINLSVECLGVEMDGSQTLRVAGVGRNRSDAREQCKKNAVWAVIFYGVREGAGGCDVRPLVTEVNAQERYEEYFNRFFADGGPYLKYVSLRDTKSGSTMHKKDRIGATYYLTVRVLRSKLKARLKEDNVID